MVWRTIIVGVRLSCFMAVEVVAETHHQMDVVLAFGQPPLRPAGHEVQSGAQVLVLVALVPVRAVVFALLHDEEDVLEPGGAVGPFQREGGRGRARGFVRPELTRTTDLSRAFAFAAI